MACKHAGMNGSAAGMGAGYRGEGMPDSLIGVGRTQSSMALWARRACSFVAMTPETLTMRASGALSC